MHFLIFGSAKAALKTWSGGETERGKPIIFSYAERNLGRQVARRDK